MLIPLGFFGGGGIADKFLAVTHPGSPYLYVYPWSSSSGFGTRYANPATLPSGSSSSITVNALSNVIITGYNAYAFNNGFGSKYANPSALPFGAVQDVTFSPNDTAVVMANQNSPGAVGYTWSNGYGATRFDVGAYTDNANSLSFSKTNDYVAFANASNSFVNTWTWTNSSGYVTRTAISGAPGTVNDVRYHPSNNAIAIGSASNIAAWTWPGKVAYAAPSVTALDARRIAWSPDGTTISVNNTSSPYNKTYAWTNASGFGAKYSDPAVAINNYGFGLDFSRSGKSIAMSSQNSPYIQTYNWSSSGFGAKYSNPVNTLSFAPDRIAFG